MDKKTKYLVIIIALFSLNAVRAQELVDSSLLTIDRIYNSSEFKQEKVPSIQWIENGNAFVVVEKSHSIERVDELVRYSTETQKKDVFISAESLLVNGDSLEIESFALSHDGSKVLIFNNSSRVWRTNTKGDYWVYDFTKRKLTQLGKKFKSSSLMFAKFSRDNKYVAYVHDFNIYKEEFKSGKITQLTFDGNGDIINGTFDWAYEEEFGNRDGFSWSPNARYIVFWQIDASEIRTFYMINNTDSIYSKPIPLQYPKVGQDPSSAKVGIINLESNKISWIPLVGDEKQNYIPGVQWVNNDLILLQQINRKQNHFIVWSYKPSTGALNKIYSEKEDTWVDISYPDISANGWDNKDLTLVNNNTAFLRMT